MPDPDLRATERQAPSGILDDPPQGPEKFILVISIYVLTIYLEIAISHFQEKLGDRVCVYSKSPRVGERLRVYIPPHGL